MIVVTNRKQFTKVALLNHIWFFQRFQNPLALVTHFRMTAYHVTPTLIGQTDGDAVARYRRVCHQALSITLSGLEYKGLMKGIITGDTFY